LGGRAGGGVGPGGGAGGASEQPQPEGTPEQQQPEGAPDEQQPEPQLNVMVRTTRGTWGELSNCEVCSGRCYLADSKQCWGCAACFHPPCLGVPAMGSLPLHCPACREEFRRAGIDDITLDELAMKAIVLGDLPDCPDELARCERL
jgi:hypothetical protein